MIIQGREISHKDIELIREMIKIHPSWGRASFLKNWRSYGTGGRPTVNLRIWPAAPSF